MYCKIIFAIGVLVQCVLGQSIPCSNIQTISNLNLELFKGTWFDIEIAMDLEDMFDYSTCGRLDTELTESGSLSVNNTRLINGVRVTILGSATVSSTDSGTLTAVLDFGAGVPFTFQLHVLDIDYDNYAILLSCTPIDESANVISWKLSRSRDGFSSEAVKAINVAVESNTYLSDIAWRTQDQSVKACGSSGAVTVAPILLLAVLAVVSLVGRA